MVFQGKLYVTMRWNFFAEADDKRDTLYYLINFTFQRMHYNFISLTMFLYMFRAHMRPSSGGSTIHSQQLVQCHLF